MASLGSPRGQRAGAAAPAVSPTDAAGFRKLWASLPANRCDRAFWLGLEKFFQPILAADCPLRHGDFFRVPHTGRVAQEDLFFIPDDLLEKTNALRALYEAFTLWNPRALSAVLKIPVEKVVEQLLLAVEHQWMKLNFALCCPSCSCDIQRFTSVNDIPFTATYHTTNAFRCPMCTDRMEIDSLQRVAVFFQLERLPSTFQRAHHRGYCTDLAEKQRLESFFCPAGSGIVFKALLPKGQYLLAAPFMETLVQLDVEVDSEALGERDPYLVKVIDLHQLSMPVLEEKMRSQKEAQMRGRSNSGSVTAVSPGFASSLVTAASPIHTLSERRATHLTLQVPSTAAQSRRRHSRMSNGSAMEMGSFGNVDVPMPPDPPVQALKHGKVQFRFYNETQMSGFMDLYVFFDRRAEFSAVTPPKLFTVPDLMHTMPRGLRSPFLLQITPRPPATTLTRGVYVRHNFELPGDDMDDPAVVAVLREVHRYSLEDHNGLLIGVSDGGQRFESSFLSVTAALASSICFFQRVLTRLNDRTALLLRTSITEGPLLVASYQGQYNDADNMRSAYPDVQFVGPVIYASNHPRIQPPKIVASSIEPSSTKRRSRLSTLASGLFDDEEEEEVERQRNTPPTLVPFEIRSVPRNQYGEPEAGAGSMCLNESYLHGEDDEVLPYFLNYLVEHFPGTKIVKDAHALTIHLALPAIQAAVQMSTLLSRAAYTKQSTGPF